MRRADQAIDAVETFSPAEHRFNRRRQTVGLIAAPIVFATILLWPSTLPPEATRLGAALAMMIVLWMTEALPLAVTALLGPTLAVLMQVAPARAAFASFADPIIFLFIGSFMLAQAMFVHGLDRRIAFTALTSRWVGRSGVRLAIVYAGVACVLSMWMSNTATTAMLFPLGLAVIAELGRARHHDRVFQQFALALMLVTSMAASLGGMGTPVGSPPNLIGKALLLQAGIDLSFFDWMIVGVPVLGAGMIFLVSWLLVPRARQIQIDDAAKQAIAAELTRLGPLTAGERNVVIAFGLTVTLWVLPGLVQIVLGQGHPAAARLTTLFPESVAAILGALTLFLLPVSWPQRKFTLNWEQASRIDWGIILLFGGGIAMGTLAESTGLSAAFGRWVAAQFPDVGMVGLTCVFTALAILMSEAASNTAAATVVVPTAIAVARAAGISPLEPALGATLGASMGFMMPISTPPNAIVYSSGYIPIGAMMRHGIVLDIAGFVIIVLAVLGISPLLR
jgi:sodium-dependent dicarboxylate transporter 2/3/5